MSLVLSPCVHPPLHQHCYTQYKRGKKTKQKQMLTLMKYIVIYFQLVFVFYLKAAFCFIEVTGFHVFLLA